MFDDFPYLLYRNLGIIHPVNRQNRALSTGSDAGLYFETEQPIPSSLAISDLQDLGDLGKDFPRSSHMAGTPVTKCNMILTPGRKRKLVIKGGQPIDFARGQRKVTAYPCDGRFGYIPEFILKGLKQRYKGISFYLRKTLKDLIYLPVFIHNFTERSKIFIKFVI
jgi:hypothetical protein